MQFCGESFDDKIRTTPNLTRQKLQRLKFGENNWVQSYDRQTDTHTDILHPYTGRHFFNRSEFITPLLASLAVG